MTDELNEMKEPKLSNDNLIGVQPKGEIISFVELECRVVLNQTLGCLVHCYDINKSKIKLYQVELTTEEYSNWTNDDELITLILSKVGLTKL